MQLSEKEITEQTLKHSGFDTLNPVQELAVKKGLLNGKNVVISAPTASGKTLCASLLGLQKFKNNRKKMLYLCPLIALAQEKFKSFKKEFSDLGIKVTLSIGDFDRSDPWLRDYDWIICSNEKADSLIRHGADWIRNVGVVVADEIHLLNDHSRGPTLEVLLTRLREMIPDAQILGLSATIRNAEELAEWLDASLVKSEWRPVTLYEGVSYDSSIRFVDRDDYQLNENLGPEASIADNTYRLKKQSLFFVSTRRNAEALAERLGKITNMSLTQDERFQLRKLSDQIKNVLEIPTHQCRRLAECVKNGTGFHHAGLLGKQKSLIEDNFRNKLIKTIVATPTLAYGVNIPAFRVVIRDVTRYYAGYGTRYIPVMEYQQMTGRAGRPGFNTTGEAILLAKSENHAQKLVETYINGDTENIDSKLSLEPVLRMHTLALIASDFANTEEKLLEFFEKTFYAYQYGDISEIDRKIRRIVDMLIEFNFLVRKNGRIFATKLGKRVSELYLDPLTAHHFVECLGKVKKTTTFSYLHMIVDTLEMRPLFSVRRKDAEEVDETVAKNEGYFLKEIPEEWDDEYDNFLRGVKTAMVLERWIEEISEDQILQKYVVTPGELRTRLRNVDWLLYSAHEIALLLGYKDLLKDLRKLRVRMKHGVKEELVPLVRLRGIGRVRARKLFKSGLESIAELRKASLERLQGVVGPKVAVNIKKQLGGKVEGRKGDEQKTLVSGEVV